MSITKNNSAFTVLQQLGRALMLPIAVLPAAGMLLGIGSAITRELTSRGIDSGIFFHLSKFMSDAGDTVFGLMPLIFAVGVVISFCKNDGSSPLSAVLMYFITLKSMAVAVDAFGLNVTTNTIWGIKTVDTGVLGGIIIGFCAAFIYKRFHKVELPSYLGFFNGKRAVPIISSIFGIFLGIILSFIWPPVGNGIHWVLSRTQETSEPLMVGIYGVVERLLLPFGLHHIWNAPFFFEIPFKDAAGNVVAHGTISGFFKDNWTDAGILSGGFLGKMFGLPAAAIAIWRSAEPSQRVKVGSIMLSAAFTSFLTGITEPIEFSFLFVAPILYGIHAVLYGLGFALTDLLNIKLGYTFSQGAIDYTVFGVIAGMGRNVWYILPLGVVWAVVYYLVFFYSIKFLNLSTPGRGSDVDTSDHKEETSKPTSKDDVARSVIEALGGKSNIEDVDACITRLRVMVKDVEQVDKAKLKALGATAVLVIGSNIQAIFGTRSEILKGEIKNIL